MNFTKAANYLNSSKSYVSKEISLLERSIGSSLFHRNTRSLQLTLSGEALLEHASQIVHALDRTEQAIFSLQNKVEGNLRITAPSAYSDYLLAPNLALFFQNYPGIKVEMILTGNLLNFVEEKIDVAVRLTHEPPQDKVAKRIGDYRMILCASKAYLEKHGTPKTPKELANHSGLVYSTERDYLKWPFKIQEQITHVSIKPILTANAALGLLNAAKNGLGIARLPDYVVKDAVEKKELIPILTEFYPSPIPIYAIYAQGRLIPPKIKAFIEFLLYIHKL